MNKTLLYCAFALSLAAASANANTTYTYVGNNFTQIEDLPRPAGAFDTSMSVSGSFTLASPLAPNAFIADLSSQVLAFSFSDGRHTLTEVDLDPDFFTLFGVKTDANGQFERWAMFVQQTKTLKVPDGADILIFSNNDPDALFSGSPSIQDFGDLGVCQVFDPPGICHTLADTASVTNAPGVWTSASSTPVPAPASLGLLAVSVLTLVGVGGGSGRRIIFRYR
jgi:hypothetical protein